MKNIILLAFILPVVFFSQSNRKVVSEIKKFQTELNAEYLDPKETPLRGHNLAGFSAHPFFPIDLNYRVRATLERTKNAIPFDLPTSSGKTQPYLEFGTVTFTIAGKRYELKIFQSLDLIKREGFQDYLFLPFRDETNGKETYGGGKYMDFRIPKTDELIVDFNKSYQPFCAYNAYDYNCPIVPTENFLPVRIEAGVKYEDVYHH